MPLGKADVVQIVMLTPCPHTLLNRHGACIVPLFESEKQILKLIHTSIGKQERWILCWNERGTGNHFVAILGKKVEKAFAYFCRFHGHYTES